MIDHISVQTDDFAAATAWYDAVLAPLGYARVMNFGGVAGYGPIGGIPAFWLGAASDPGGRQTHIAFSAVDRAAVLAFHRVAVELGTRCCTSRGSGRSTTRTTSGRSSATRTATTSRPSATAPPNDRHRSRPRPPPGAAGGRRRNRWPHPRVSGCGSSIRRSGRNCPAPVSTASGKPGPMPARSCRSELAPFAARPYSRLRWWEDEANSSAGAAVSGVAPKVPRQMQLTGAAAIDSAAADGWRAFLLCDDVGTGKTITLWLGALAIADRICARRADPCRILVLVDRPAAITIPHWRNTIAAVGDGGHRILISSPDQLPKLLSRNGRPWARWDIVIADECHLYRNTSTRRTEVFQRVARFDDPPGKAPFLLLASATPGQHPAELTYLGPVVAQLRGERPTEWSDFGDRLAGVGLPIVKGTFGKWGWNERAAADPLMQQEATEQVRGWLADNDPPLTLHRAAPWGPPPVELMPVELDPAEQDAYRTLWRHFQQAIAALLADRPTGVGADPTVRNRVESRSSTELTCGTRRPDRGVAVPAEGVTAARGATVEWVQAQVQAGYQVAISCEFLGAAAIPIGDQLQAKGIDVARIHGGIDGGRCDRSWNGCGSSPGVAAAVVFTPSASLSLQASEQLADGRSATRRRASD